MFSIVSFVKELHSKRIWSLYLVNWIIFTGMVVVSPYMQTELTNYFARKHSDDPIECTGHHHHKKELFAAGHAPLQACIRAHTDVLAWIVGKTILRSFTVSLFLNPAVGTWSDMYGRKPFLITSYLLQLLPMAVIYGYLKWSLPLELYFVAQFFSFSFSMQTIYLAYISDVIVGEYRMSCFGLLQLMLSLGLISGTALTIKHVITSLEQAVVFGTIILVVGLLFLIFFIKESLSKDLQNQAREAAAEKTRLGRCNSSSFYWHSFSSSIRILWRTPLFRRLSIILFIIMTVSEEFSDFSTQYLQETLHFGTREQAKMSIVMGITGMFLMTFGIFIVKVLLKLNGKYILLLGNSIMTVGLGFMATAKADWMAYASMACITFWMFQSMAVSSMKADNVRPDEQGAVQGALGAISALGTGLGPLLYLGLFVVFREGGIYVPSVPFYFAFGLMIISVLIGFTIKLPAKNDDLYLPLEMETKIPLIPLG